MPFMLKLLIFPYTHVNTFTDGYKTTVLQSMKVPSFKAVPESSTINKINLLGSDNNTYNTIISKSFGNKNCDHLGSTENCQGKYYPGDNIPKTAPRPALSEALTLVAFSAVRAHTRSSMRNFDIQHVRFERTITEVGYGWDPRDSYFE